MSWKSAILGLSAALLIPTLASAATETFSSPTLHGLRLDWCAHFGSDCGKPAADLFCRENGFSEAARFAIDQNIGQRGVHTLVFGDGRTCNGPTCSGFSAITCIKTDIAQPPPAVTPEAVAPSQPVLVQPPPKAVLKPGPAIIARPSSRPSPPSGKPVTGEMQMPVASAKAGNLLIAYPEGANLYHCTSGCEFRLSTDIVMSPKDKFQLVGFTGDVKKVPHANAFLWQVTTAPYPAFGKGVPSDFSPPHLVASGEFTGSVHDIPIDFQQLAGAPTGRTIPPGSFYIRILPTTAPGKKILAGTPSNVIRVYYTEKPPPQPPLHLPNTNPPYLFDIKLLSFTPPDFEDPNRWGCVLITGYTSAASSIVKTAFPLGERCPASYKGQGNNITSFGDLVDAATGALTDLWDWVSNKYNDIKQLAVDIAMNYTPFGLQCKAAASAIAGDDAASYCRAAAEIGVNAGMAALGVPPSIPNYNQLIDQGVDSAVDLAADEITDQTGIPCVGPCKDALKKGLDAAADNLKKSSYAPGCVGADEAHQNGREPLCLPPGVLAKPAPGAVYRPPVATIAVTRTPYDRDPNGLFKGPCDASVSLKFDNTFPAQTVSGPFHNSKNIPTTPIQGMLYLPAGAKLPESMPKGSTQAMTVVFQAGQKFEFPWTHELWQQSQIPARDSLGPMGPDWFALYSGSTITVSSGIACGQSAGPIVAHAQSLY